MYLINLCVAASVSFAYILITFEHYFKVNKAAVALGMAGIAWGLVFCSQDKSIISLHLDGYMGGTCQLIIFLFGALAIVEIINAYKGFACITNKMRLFSKRKLFWMVGGLSFIFSALIDNLTTTLLFVALTQKLIAEKEERLLFGGMIVIAANAGGAWTPIGDVTTTMLWIGGQISSVGIMKAAFLPCAACSLAALSCLSFHLKTEKEKESLPPEVIYPSSLGVLIAGLAVLLSVPLLKLVLGVPPFLGVLLGLALIWGVLDWLCLHEEGGEALKVGSILSKVDASTLLFFLGILMAVHAVEETGLLEKGASFFFRVAGEAQWIALGVGFLSALIDNVPLVAALQGMFESQFAPDSFFWHLLAYTAGTGGSLLIIGSAAGIAFMGLEKVTFFAFLKKISWAALVGYLAGIAVFFLI